MLAGKAHLALWHNGISPVLLHGWDHFLNEAHRCGVYMLTLVGKNTTSTTCQARTSYQDLLLRGAIVATAHMKEGRDIWLATNLQQNSESVMDCVN